MVTRDPLNMDIGKQNKGRREKMHSEQLHHSNSLPNIFMVIKLNIMRAMVYKT
jgi:hypothetical protein